MEIMWKSRAKKAVGFCGGYTGLQRRPCKRSCLCWQSDIYSPDCAEQADPELAHELRAPCRNRYPLPFRGKRCFFVSRGREHRLSVPGRVTRCPAYLIGLRPRGPNEKGKRDA